MKIIAATTYFRVFVGEDGTREIRRRMIARDNDGVLWHVYVREEA